MTSLGDVVPSLRIFDTVESREFYSDLGFRVRFEHRFVDDWPLYIGIKRDACELHLTEHHGDATPGSHVRITATGLDAFAASLAAKQYRYAKPGPPQAMPWGTSELTITDPFGNRLTFSEAPHSTAAS